MIDVGGAVVFADGEDIRVGRREGGRRIVERIEDGDRRGAARGVASGAVEGAALVEELQLVQVSSETSSRKINKAADQIVDIIQEAAPQKVAPRRK